MYEPKLSGVIPKREIGIHIVIKDAITLSCGAKVRWFDLKDIKCPCGNPNHWLLKVENGQSDRK